LKFIWVIMLPVLLYAQSISEKKNAIAQKSGPKEQTVQAVNETLAALRKELSEHQAEAAKLHQTEAPAELFSELLTKVVEARRKILQVEEEWRRTSAGDSQRSDDSFALWDQEEATLGQIVAEYGSQEFLYVVPPEMAAMKINLHSNLAIPREAWSQVLEIVLMHNGVGLKQINPFARQLYLLKQEFGAVQSIASNREDLEWVAGQTRVFYLLSPPIEQVKTVFSFFERFSDAKQTFVHQIGSKVALIASKDEVIKLLSLYDTVWQGRGGKVSKVISISKVNVREMEKILTAFFNENIEKTRPPFGKVEQEGLGVFPLAHSNTLVLIGSKEVVERAERIVHDTEEQLQDPAEMTVFLYTCRQSDPQELAQVLEKVYISLVHGAQEGATKETEITISAQSPGGGKIPDGYPPIAPLVVAPTPLKSATTGHVEIEEGPSEHFIPDPKSGTILMTVRRDVLGKIKELLKKLDIPKKMVEIEVLLFERKLNSRNDLGLNLLRLGKSRNGAQYTPLGGPSISISEGLNSAVKGVLQFFFHGPSHKYTPHFDLAYNFLMTQEDIQLNASPSVMTVNQSPAMISIVEERSINSGAAPIDTNKGTSFEKAFNRAQFGIIIKITPNIHPPENEGEKGQVTLSTDISFDTTNSLPSDDQPLVDRRHITNEVRVVDGETIILGGLRRKTKIDTEEKIPILGEIPGFGKLFGTSRLTDNETEMLFFITPKIVLDPAAQLEKLREEDLKKRPGDLPEFLQRVIEAQNKEKNRFFKQSLKLLFNNNR